MSYLPSLGLYRWPKSPRTLGFRFWIGSEVFEFGVENSNLEWCFQVRSGVLEFGVAFSNSEWSFRIRSEVFEFGVKFWNLEWAFRIKSELLESGMCLKIRSVNWNSECTCGPPYNRMSSTYKIIFSKTTSRYGCCLSKDLSFSLRLRY